MAAAPFPSAGRERDVVVAELVRVWHSIEHLRGLAWKAGDSARVEAFEAANRDIERRITTLGYTMKGECVRPAAVASEASALARAVSDAASDVVEDAKNAKRDGPLPSRLARSLDILRKAVEAEDAALLEQEERAQAEPQPSAEREAHMPKHDGSCEDWCRACAAARRPSALEETAWLIEATSANGPVWFRGRNGRMWGTANEAIRFARREDAEAMIAAWGSWELPSLVAARVTEHAWIDAALMRSQPAAPQAPAAGEDGRLLESLHRAFDVFASIYAHVPISSGKSRDYLQSVIDQTWAAIEASRRRKLAAPAAAPAGKEPQ